MPRLQRERVAMAVRDAARADQRAVEEAAGAVLGGQDGEPPPPRRVDRVGREFTLGLYQSAADNALPRRHDSSLYVKRRD